MRIRVGVSFHPRIVAEPNPTPEEFLGLRRGNMRSNLVLLALVLSVLLIHPIAGFAESSAADVEIKDIHWEMGPPMPWPTKGQAQVVIGETIVAAGSPG